MVRTITFTFGWLVFAVSLMFGEIYFIAPAAAEQTVSQSGSSCRVEPLSEWLEQERWVWRTVCEGMTANLAKQFGGSEKPAEAERWPETRTLTSKFIETILLKEPFRGGLGRAGVRISGARIKERIDLAGAEIKNEFWLDNSFFENGITLGNAHSTNRITFDGSRSAGEVDLVDFWVEKELSLSHGGEFGAVNLLDAKIAGNVRMENSNFAGKLYMDGLQVGGNLFMRKKSKFRDVVLRGAKIGRQLGLYDTTVDGVLDMDSLQVGENLLMYENSHFKQVKLFGTRVVGNIEMGSSLFSGLLEMDNVRVDGSIHMSHGAKFEEVNLSGIKVAGRLELSGSTFSKKLTMHALNIERGLFLNEFGRFNEIEIVAGRVGEQLAMSRSKFEGNVKIDSLSVLGNVLLHDAEFSGNVELILGKIDGSVALAGAKIRQLDLSETVVNGELSLEQFFKPVLWEKKSIFILRNTAVGTVVDSEKSWPADLTLDLGGFSFQRWGGLTGLPPNIRDRSGTHPAIWFANSLDKDRHFSPQPYDQLAKILRTMGYSSAAEDILYQGKKRALLEETSPWYSKAWQGLQLVFIGFGHRLQYAVVWTAFFIAVGAVVISRTVEGKQNGIRFGFGYSIDILLPLVKLREMHYDIDFSGGWRPARYYFYFHKIMGYVLASFLIAGLSGLTK